MNEEIVEKLTKILVVEDSGLQAKAFVKLLKDLGFSNVTACPSANSARTQLEKDKYDLIFCDWQMPEKTGLDFLIEIKKIPEFANIPFVFLTAFAEKERVIIALKSGANDYLLKPAIPELLKQKLAKYIL